ncbi:MAG: CDP-alcohol phosphatidyltransferase family protein [Candidatus Altiarchaeota archaeon]
MLKAKFSKRTSGLDVRIGILFSKFGISANAWTILSIIPAILGFMALSRHNLGAGLLLFAASAFIDVIDGTVARVTKSVSNLGAFLDGVMDRYVEFLLILGLWIYLEDVPSVLLPNGAWMLMLLFGATMPSFIRAYADHRNVISDQEKLKNIGGLLERFERLTLIYLGMLLGLFDPQMLVYVIILTVILSNLTALQRIYGVIRSS